MPNYVGVITSFTGNQRDINKLFKMLKTTVSEDTTEIMQQINSEHEQVTKGYGNDPKYTSVSKMKHFSNYKNRLDVKKQFRTLCKKYHPDTNLAKTIPITFNNIIPVPDNIFQGDLGEAEREKYGTNNWYDWKIKNWGTKWYALHPKKNRKALEFDTA